MSIRQVKGHVESDEWVALHDFGIPEPEAPGSDTVLYRLSAGCASRYDRDRRTEHSKVGTDTAPTRPCSTNAVNRDRSPLSTALFCSP
jgi:hypothetical protein